MYMKNPCKTMVYFNTNLQTDTTCHAFTRCALKTRITKGSKTCIQKIRTNSSISISRERETESVCVCVGQWYAFHERRKTPLKLKIAGICISQTNQLSTAHPPDVRNIMPKSQGPQTPCCTNC
jgi:hypothetical protein